MERFPPFEMHGVQDLVQAPGLSLTRAGRVRPEETEAFALAIGDTGLTALNVVG